MSSTLRVSPLQREDIEPVLDLVLRQEFARGHSAAEFRRLYEYPWVPDRSDSGFVLRDGERVVGCLGAVYSVRRWNGQSQRVCNMSTWYIEPEYRNCSLALLMSILQLPDHVITNLTASPDVAKIVEKLGFAAASRNRILFRAGVRTPGPRKTSCRVLHAERDFVPLLTDEHLRLFQDHRDYDCGHYVLSHGRDYCYVVTKRRKVKGTWLVPAFFPRRIRERWYPVTDVLFASSPSLLGASLHHLRAAVLRRERTVGLTIEECYLEPGISEGVRIPHASYVYNPTGASYSFDSLYSELVLLPI